MVRFMVLYDQPKDTVDFDHHYREIHIPLAKKLPGLRRYTISRNARPVQGGEAYYLVAELDWDDMDALAAARPNMLATLDSFRDCLDSDTDPVSGPVVLELR